MLGIAGLCSQVGQDLLGFGGFVDGKEAAILGAIAAVLARTDLARAMRDRRATSLG